MKETRGFDFTLNVLWVHSRSQPVCLVWMWRLMPRVLAIVLCWPCWRTSGSLRQQHSRGIDKGWCLETMHMGFPRERRGNRGQIQERAGLLRYKSCSSRREIYGLLSLFPGYNPASFQKAAKAVCWLCWLADIRSFHICDRADDLILILENTRFCYYLVAKQILNF